VIVSSSSDDDITDPKDWREKMKEIRSSIMEEKKTKV
jgi:hypothetical protein